MNEEAKMKVRKEMYGVTELNGAFRHKIQELFYKQTREMTMRTKVDLFEVQFSDRWF